MTQRVIQDNEISLNSVRYPLVQPVKTVLASLYPSKVVLGDTTKDSQIYSSVAAWGDFRGGIGAEEVVSIEEPLDRAWWSTLKGFKQSFELYTADGYYLPGLEPTQAKLNEYYAEQRQFVEDNPMPVEVVDQSPQRGERVGVVAGNSPNADSHKPV